MFYGPSSLYNDVVMVATAELTQLRDELCGIQAAASHDPNLTSRLQEIIRKIESHLDLEDDEPSFEEAVPHSPFPQLSILIEQAQRQCQQ